MKFVYFLYVITKDGEIHFLGYKKRLSEKQMREVFSSIKPYGEDGWDCSGAKSLLETKYKKRDCLEWTAFDEDFKKEHNVSDKQMEEIHRSCGKKVRGVYFFNSLQNKLDKLL